MNLENLKIGQIYKNYKTLCEALDEAVKSSSSKEAQLKIWATYFRWERNGHQYIIKEIFDTQTHTQLNTTPFTEPLYTIIIYYLYQESLTHQSKKFFPKLINQKNYFYNLFGFCNMIDEKPFLPCRSDSIIYDEVKKDCLISINNAFKQTLEKLKKNNRIISEKKYYICPLLGGKQYISDEIHTEIIKSNSALVIKQLGCKSLYEVVEKDLYSNYISALNDYIAQYGYCYCSSVIELSLPPVANSKEFLEDLIKHGIQKKYNKIFDGMTAEEVQSIVESTKKTINELILEILKLYNEKAICEFAIHNSYTDRYTFLKDTIIAALKADYGEDLLENDYIETYRKKRTEFTDKIIKIS